MNNAPNKTLSRAQRFAVCAHDRTYATRTIGVVALGCALGCGAPVDGNPNPKIRTRSIQPIVGGLAVEAGAWPNVVSMQGTCTGTLVADDLVVYAGHCGEEFESVWLTDQVEIEVSQDGVTIAPAALQHRRSVEYCRTHPDTLIADGTDLAVCLLKDPIPQVPLIPIISECERARIAGEANEPNDATLVGYGFEGPAGTNPGQKRVVSAPIEDIGKELVIGTDSAGTCAGDSGGPAFVQLADAANSDLLSWRLLGVLSSGTPGDCGKGEYVDLSLHTDWIETVSQRDVTPCVDGDGSWAPTHACVAPSLDQRGLIDESAGAPRYAGTCGTPFDEGEAIDKTGPTTSFALVEFRRVDAEFEWQVVALADDFDGTGVRRVRVEWYDGESLLAARADEIPPYEFFGVSTPHMASMLKVVATDHAGNESAAIHGLRSDADSGSGCAMGSLRPPPSSSGVAGIVLLRLLWWRSSRTGRRSYRSGKRPA